MAYTIRKEFGYWGVYLYHHPLRVYMTFQECVDYMIGHGLSNKLMEVPC